MTSAADGAALRALIQTLRDQAAQAGHRRLLVLSGSREWGLGHAVALCQGYSSSTRVWVGNSAPNGIEGLTGREVLRLLGSETGLLVVDAWSGFDPDAFGAATGMVTEAGLVVLVTPPLEQWSDWPDPELRRISMDGVDPKEMSGRFIRRLVQVLEADTHAVIVREGHALPVTQPSVGDAMEPVPTGPWRTADQARAVEAVLQVVSGHRRRPLVLTADRGRGKSAALGLAVDRLAMQCEPDVVVTAPDIAAVDAVFRHAGPVPGLRYVAPARLLSERPRAQLLLVDEAAGLPVASLVELVRHYPRVVFSTTVHGYEGTGRGFALRFRKQLDTLAPGWRALHLETPVRWAPRDPVEHFTFRALLLDAAMARSPEPDDGNEITVRALDRDWLLEHPQVLEELFGLLVQAHYRTRPLDLRNLLDGPRLTIHAAFSGDALVGAVLAVREGGFDAARADAIWAGLRRPHGHLLPQSLAAHVGIRRAPTMAMLRIMRIAVHPDCQRRGIGRRLVEAVVAQAGAGDMALTGTSFGVTPDLLGFWQACGWRVVRVGTRRDAASGAHSVLMVRALDGRAEILVDEACGRFSNQFRAQLTDPLRDLDPALVSRLLEQSPECAVPGRTCWEDAVSFAWGRREFGVGLSGLRAVSWWGLASPGVRDNLQPGDAELLVLRVLQGRGWKAVTEATGLPGRAGVIRVLRQAVRTLARAGAPVDLLSDPLFSRGGSN